MPAGTLRVRRNSEPARVDAVQGRGDACLSAPESYRLNWATAIASLDATSLEAGTPVTYDIPALHTTPTNMVIVKTNVSGTPSPPVPEPCRWSPPQQLTMSLLLPFLLRPAQWLNPHEHNLYFSLRVKVSPRIELLPRN